jgi:glycerol-3-phosphate dehydrogenase
MRRDLTRLCSEPHDLIVVGGGIYGACVAWEAARRGLKVALIEAGDFGQGTSSNSLRTLHGGLRHLQRLDFVHMRESIRERREWLRLAPELARPLRFVLPMSGDGIKSPLILRTALWINDLLSADRNEGVRSDRHLPGGSLLTTDELESHYPGLSVANCNAAVAWYDAICLNTERLQLAVVAAAVACRAQAANYVRALQPLMDRLGIRGVRVRDELSGREMELHAPLVINAAGPWIEEWLGCNARIQTPLFRASRAFNLLVRELPFREGLGLSARLGNLENGDGVRSATYFIIPWNGYSLVGTRHLRCHHTLRSPEVSREDVLGFLADLNPLLGKHRLNGADVRGVFSGLLPEAASHQGLDVALQRAPRIIDHSREGLRGLFSIIGVKWTTARAVGERAATLACRRLGRPDQPDRERALASVNAIPQLDADPALAARVVPDFPIALAHIVHAVRHEMAMRLQDVIRRRTPLYLSAALDRSALAACAAVLARELRWNRREIAAEIDSAEAQIAAFRGPLQANPRPAAA